MSKRVPIVVLIPARFASSRFPGKPLALLCGKPMIQWVYEQVVKAVCVDDVYVATDDERIKNCVEGFGGEAVMTSADHNSGSDRLAEAARIMGLTNDTVILNVQGDEPVIQPEMIEELASTISLKDDVMGTLCERIKIEKDIEDSNIVKVVRNEKGEALYFSRSPIPYYRNKEMKSVYYRHVGVYAYRAEFLQMYTKLPVSHLEQVEQLEQLRVLEAGYKIKVRETLYHSYGIDTPEQLKGLEEKIATGRM